jgi:flavin reductase (DIM6/NTAB) family NADH-FMN oxidoreductase RutF
VVSVALDSTAFFEVMSAFPSGVGIVTTLDAEGQPKGLTTTAITSVSAEPPMLLVCVDRGSRTLPALRHHGSYVVNFVRVGREELAMKFASRADDKFAGLEWAPSTRGIPILSDHAVGWVECETERVIEAGDHVLFLGRALDGHPPHPDHPPAIYFRRRFGVWSATDPVLAEGTTKGNR